MAKTISEVMMREHRKIDEMLEDFEKLETTNYKESKNAFNVFKWNLDKHFFVEEKVIFHIYNSSTEEESFDVINLLKDHKDIQWLVSKTEESLKSNLKPSILELKKSLKAHAGMEDQVFYPKLDKELNQEEKSMILEKTEEIFNE